MKRALVWCLAALLFAIVSASGERHASLADDPAANAGGEKKGNEGAKKSETDAAKPSVTLRTGEAEIEKTLTEPTQLEFQETPLKDVIEYISSKHRLAIQMDEEALKSGSIVPEALPITFRANNISLKSALQQLLDGPALTSVVMNEVLFITSKEKAATIVFNKVYDVRDVLMPTETQVAFDSLIDLITSTIQPETWSEVGGPGMASAVRPGMLAIAQNQDVQAKVTDLLLALRQAKDQVQSGKFESPIAIGPDRAEKEIEKRLAEKINLSFAETSLFEVVGSIQKSHHVPIRFDSEALKTASIDPTSLVVTGQWNGMSLRSALNLILQPFTLTWFVDHEGILITTKEKADVSLKNKLYLIGDLIATTAASGNVAADEAGSDSDELIDAITSIVATPTWSNMGGPATIQPYGNGKNTLLVVLQTSEVQDQVADFLAQLRAVRRQQEASAQQAAQAKEPEEVVLKVYELQAPKPGTPMMTPQEAAEVVKSLVKPKSWTENDAYIRGVTGKLIVRQIPSVQRQIEKLLIQLQVYQPKSAWGGLGGGIGGGGIF